MEKSRPLPSKLVLKNFATTSWLPLIGLFPLAVALPAYIGMSAAGSLQLEDWRIPLLSISFLGVVAFILSGLFELGMRWWEIRCIRRVYDETWAVFPQYKSEEQWQRFIHRDRENELANLRFEWGGLIFVSIVVGVIGAAWLASGSETDAIFALAGFELIVVALITGRWLREKWNISGRYQRRLRMSPPAVLISKTGVYHEDDGFDSLNHLKAIVWKDATKSRPAKIIFTTRFHIVETLLQPSHAGVPRFYNVEAEILKDDESTGKALMERFQNEGLVKEKNWLD